MTPTPNPSTDPGMPVTLLPDSTPLADASFNWYQQQAKTFDLSAKDPRDSKHVHILGLAGEAGEVCEKWKKHLRDGRELNVADLKKELGDVLWYVALVAHDNGVDLADVAVTNINKLADRYQRGVLLGSGDNR